MEPFIFEDFSSNDHNGLLEDCNITFTDKTDGADPTRIEEYWRRVLKTATPYGLNKIDWLLYLGKFLNSCKILCIFSREGCLHRKIDTSATIY